MTEPNPCNCSTCKFGTKHELATKRPHAHIFECSVQNGKWMPSKDDGGVTFITGCLSHPDARMWINRHIIKELELRKANCDEIKSRLPVTSESYGMLNIASKSLYESIKLLKADSKDSNTQV